VAIGSRLANAIPDDIIHESGLLIHVHDAATPAVDHARSLDRIVLPALAFAGLLAFLAAPRGAGVQLSMLAAAPIVALFVSRKALSLAQWPPLLVAALLLAGYVAINASWSVDRTEAYGKVAFLVFVIVIVHIALTGLPQLDDRLLREVQRAAVIAVFAGAAFLAFEILSDRALMRLFFSLVPAARPDPKHAKVADGWVVYIGAYVMNRSMAALSLALWPILLMLRTLLSRKAALAAGAVLLAISGIAIFKSEHETSMLALLFAVPTFAGMLLSARLMRFLVIAGWITATMLVVPIAMVAFNYDLHHAKWIPETGRNRVILWSYTANEIKKAPFLGVGVASTKELDEARAPIAEKPADFTYPLRTGRHSHNVFMQTWYELGAIGALLLLALGLAAIRTLGRLPVQIQVFALASFVSAVLIGSFSWGIWQTWFLAAYGIWALILGLALEGARRVGSPAGSPA